MRKILGERGLMVLIAVLIILSCLTAYANISSLTDRVNNTPNVARIAARQEATLVAREQADRRADATLRTAQLAACKRDQIVYRYYNGQTAREYNAALHTVRSGMATYAAFRFVAHLQLKVARLPGSPRGRQRRHRIERAVGYKILRAAWQIRANAKAAQANARGMQYLPPTNCTKLVNHPETYRPPASINWGAHLAQSR